MISLLAMLNVACLDAPARRSGISRGTDGSRRGIGQSFSCCPTVRCCSTSRWSWHRARDFSAGGRSIAGGECPGCRHGAHGIDRGRVCLCVLASLRGRLLLASAPALLWLLQIGPIVALGPVARAAIAAGLLMIPVVLAIGWVLLNQATDGYWVQ